jgi:hypothetical protein
MTHVAAESDFGEPSVGEPSFAGPDIAGPEIAGPDALTPQSITPDSTAHRRTTRGTVVRIAASFLLGIFIGALGTASHRSFLYAIPMGLVLGLIMTASLALMCRAWVGRAALAAAGVGWLIAVQILSLQGAGGDILVLDPSAQVPWSWAGVIFSYGGLVLFGAVALCPSGWFTDRRLLGGYDSPHGGTYQ